ncbi:MAG TPA: SAM-dependent chlorinase/fluorinase [Chitinophagales bacterium]|nr:SAM-dependent chlorinase/fluorinase [Chitinophagales bacterium]
MAIVTLTSDLGNKDPYVAILKAGILHADTSVKIVDISNEVIAFDISQGAYFLRTTYHYFPKGTIHLASVDAGNSFENCIALRYNDHFFIGPDNGILSLVTDTQADEIVLLPKSVKQSTFAARDVFVNACIQLLQGRQLSEIGTPLQHMRIKIPITPPANSNFILAGVIHIDRFGNIILNVTRSQFDNIVQGREVRISYSRNNVFEKISNNYSDVKMGEQLILFNSADHLEIAVNNGNAQLLLGLHLEDRIQIEIK